MEHITDPDHQHLSAELGRAGVTENQLQEFLDAWVHDIAEQNAASQNPYKHATPAYERHMQEASMAASDVNNSGIDAQLTFIKAHLSLNTYELQPLILSKF